MAGRAGLGHGIRARSIGLALGAAPMSRKGQYKLAVRVIGGRRGDARALMPDLSSIPDRELDVAEGVRYTPRLSLEAGGSCGHFKITAGTLGAFVEDDRNYYILSNNHVLANSDVAQKGDIIWQPGRIDASPSGRTVIGHLERWVRLSTTKRDGVDAALALFSDEVEEFYPWHYDGIGSIRPDPITDRYSVRRVLKRGRTTGLTRGEVSAFELDGVQIDYGTAARPKVVTFDDQLEFIGSPRRKPFSDGGDSGSLIVDAASKRPYALLYGGGPDALGIDRTLGHFLPDVLRRLKVRMVR
jgi:hypothetical protein